MVGAGAGIIECAIRCLITVKFDDEKPGVWLAHKNGASDVPLVLEKGAQFSKRLGAAKKVMVEVVFWRGTFKQYKFEP